MKRAYVNLPTSWLNNYEIMNMPDADFRRFVIEYAHDPANIHYEVDISQERAEWKQMRAKRAAEVFARDENKCAYCGSSQYLEIDHIVPLYHGGSSDPDNLQILCRSCNRRKAAKMP